MISEFWRKKRSLIFNGVLWDILFEGCVFFQCKTAILWTWLSVIEIGSIWIRVNLPLTCQTSLWMKDSTATPGNSTTLRLFFFFHQSIVSDSDPSPNAGNLTLTSMYICFLPSKEKPKRLIVLKLLKKIPRKKRLEIPQKNEEGVSKN